MLGAAEPLAQHLLGEIRHDLGQAVDEHAPDERRLGIRRIGTEPLGERSLVGAGVGDGGPLEPAVGTGDVDDDEVCQPRRRHPGDALEPGVRLHGRRQDLAGLDEQLQPPFAIGLRALRVERDRHDSDRVPAGIDQGADGGVHADRRAVAAPDVELALPCSSGGGALADLARQADLCFGDHQVQDRTAGRGVGRDAEQLLGGGIPDRNPEVRVGDHDGRRSLADHIRRHDLLDDVHGPPRGFLGGPR